MDYDNQLESGAQPSQDTNVLPVRTASNILPKWLPWIAPQFDNLRKIVATDILMPSFGGAGSSLLAALLIELGYNFIDFGSEQILPDGTSTRATDPITRRLRPNLYFDRERSSETRSFRQGPRFIKTHLPVEEFSNCAFGGVWLLVRDPRDAIYSLHQFHLAFATQECEQVPESFKAFLEQPFFTDEAPVAMWATFYAAWLERARSCDYAAIVRFEDLKRHPLKALQQSFKALQLAVSDADVQGAIERSSFASMRVREDAVATQGDPKRANQRIMRRGKVEEWREWMTPELNPYFVDPKLVTIARQFGYELDTA